MVAVGVTEAPCRFSPWLPSVVGSSPLNALCKFRKVTEAVGVTGSIFNNKEIYSIVIDNISFNPIQGNSSVVPFTIEATSDNPYELTL